jgi:hypothetical protein
MRYQKVHLATDYPAQAWSIVEERVELEGPRTVVGQLALDVVLGWDRPDKMQIGGTATIEGGIPIGYTESRIVPGAGFFIPQTYAVQVQVLIPPLAVQSVTVDSTVVKLLEQEIEVPGDIDFAAVHLGSAEIFEDGQTRVYAAKGKNSSIALSNVTAFTCTLSAYSALAQASMLMAVYEPTELDLGAPSLDEWKLKPHQKA